MARFLLIAIAIFLILNIAAITALLRIHPRRRRLIIAIAVICNLMWLFLPLLNARTDFSRAVRAILGPQLSAREKSILRSLIEGASNKSIARKFDLAEATVKVHVKAILRKIQVQNRTQAAIWGMNNEFSTQTANANALPSASDMSNRPPKVIGPSLRNQPNLGIGTSPD